VSVVGPERADRLMVTCYRYLCHESCDRTGNVYEVGGGWVAQARWQRSCGVVFPKEGLTLENISSQIDEIEVRRDVRCQMRDPH
jgi:hypothetical protein